jgi:hypothetical protein
LFDFSTSEAGHHPSFLPSPQDNTHHTYTAELCGDAGVEVNGFGYDYFFPTQLQEQSLGEETPCASLAIACTRTCNTYSDQGERDSEQPARPEKPSTIIKEWFIGNVASPYPTSEEKIALAARSGLSEKQVKICLKNLRARKKAGKNDRVQYRVWVL